MKKTKLLALVLAFLMLFSSVGVFAEEISQNPAQELVQDTAQNPTEDTTEDTTEEPVQQIYQLSAETIALRDNIAGVLAEVEDSWTAFDMALYQKLPDAVCDMTDSAKQAVINSSIDTAMSDVATASDLAKAEIVLRSLGIDSNELYTYNSNDSISNAGALANADHTSSGHYSVPWILLANIQGNTNLTDSQIETLIEVLQQNSANGTFGYEWEGITYPDPDTAAAVLAALAPIYDTNAQAQTLCDEILSAFDTIIAENGSFGNANSDAMVIIGLIAMGENPYEFKNKTTQTSVVDGLLSYVNEANNGFTFYGNDNFMATEQGFRALVALSLYEGSALNIYDFSKAEVLPARQQSTQSITPVIPDGEGGGIAVIITIKSDTEYWINTLRMTVPEGAAVYDAFVAAISSRNDMSAIGAEKGYVHSITKEGVTLAEFDKGKNSGWLYKVNGQKPTVGLGDFLLHDGDDIVWYYTEDWTIDAPSVSGGTTNGWGSGYGGSESKPKDEPEKEPEITEPEEPEEEPVIIPIPEFSDVEGHWAKDAIEYVALAGVMNGVAEGEFAPDEKLTRAMLVTMLYRLSEDADVGENEFSDIADNAWYAPAANWASKNNITSGYGDGVFAPDDYVTREQLVLFLMRYAEYKKIELSYTESNVTDDDKISDWAKESVHWAKENGIITGRDDGSFDPEGGATRGEIAAVFMRFCENILK